MYYNKNERIIHILLVEDELKSAKLFEIYLSKPNIYNVKFVITLSKSMDEVLNELFNKSFDIILLDLHLPDSKGFETFETIIEKYPNIPIIILTNLQNDELILLCLKEGAQDYIFKSEANPYILQQSIIHSFERFQLHMELKESKNHLANFAHIVAHDLKNPIQSILTLSGMIKYYYHNDDSVNLSSYIDKLEDRLIDVSKMIDNLLLFSINDKKNMVIEEIDINKCIESVRNNLSSIIKETNTNIIDEPIPIIRADKGQIIHLLQNMIENSIKYKSNNSPIIEISSKIKDNKIVISVKDNGIGIPKNKQEKVFELFNQAHKKSNKKGFGIGLSICKKIVERHNGKIFIESEEGKGTEFNISLPYQ